jgi:hypothetical protein
MDANTVSMKYENVVEITIKSGETGEVLQQVETHNDTSDNFAAPDVRIYVHDRRGNHPYLFLLQDDPSGQTKWDKFLTQYGVGYNPLQVTANFNNAWRKDPWAPYSYHQGRGGDTQADHYWAGNTWAMQGGKHRLFFKWVKLPGVMFNLRAMGLGSFEYTGGDDAVDGVTGDTPGFFRLQTLLVLPAALHIRGRDNGNQTPDILEVSYYVSVVAVE